MRMPSLGGIILCVCEGKNDACVRVRVLGDSHVWSLQRTYCCVCACHLGVKLFCVRGERMIACARVHDLGNIFLPVFEGKWIMCVHAFSD